MIGLDAINCKTGDPLAQEQVTAENKEHILNVLDQAATKFREKLGESVGTVEKFDAALDRPHTYLEALKALLWELRLCRRKAMRRRFHFLISPSNSTQTFLLLIGLSEFHIRISESPVWPIEFAKGYNFRDKVSERENFVFRFPITSSSGELEKTIQTYELWARQPSK